MRPASETRNALPTKCHSYFGSFIAVRNLQNGVGSTDIVSILKIWHRPISIASEAAVIKRDCTEKPNGMSDCRQWVRFEWLAIHTNALVRRARSGGRQTMSTLDDFQWLFFRPPCTRHLIYRVYRCNCTHHREVACLTLASCVRFNVPLNTL